MIKVVAEQCRLSVLRVSDRSANRMLADDRGVGTARFTCRNLQNMVSPLACQNRSVYNDGWQRGFDIDTGLMDEVDGQVYVEDRIVGLDDIEDYPIGSTMEVVYLPDDPTVIWPADTRPTEQTAYLGIGGLVILGAVVLLVAEFV